ncbi:hypothetical protein SNE40_016658 [Patella caerulea]|uniref:Uncharacterized protein n=1 Tax=Patella caerulea TaxID=87958 RepID=A0AAN8PNV9_PATCE
MSDTFQNIISNLVWGFRDSILGMFKAFKLDSEIPTEHSSRTVEPMTALAKRRAEKSKHKDTVKESSEPKVTQRIALCCAWNGGVCLMSIFIFNYCVLPIIFWVTEIVSARAGSSNTVWSWLSVLLSATFDALWILPLFVLSKIVNCFWFQDIADAAYLKTRGKPQLPSISRFIADMSFSLLLQALFLIQAMLIKLLPIWGIGHLISLVHICLLYALYAFEYKWFNMGLEVHTRLAHIETNWAYFCGFGLPLAVVTSLPSSNFQSGCIFSIIFPLVIISANEAVEPTEPFEFPLKLFAPVVSISNSIFHRSVSKRTRNVSSSSSRSSSTSSTPQKTRH